MEKKKRRGVDGGERRGGGERGEGEGRTKFPHSIKKLKRTFLPNFKIPELCYSFIGTLAF